MRYILTAALLASASLGASAAPQDSQDQAQFQGEYDLQDGSRLSVNHRHHQLYARLDDGTTASLIATGPTSFTSSNGKLRIEFIQSANGSVSGVKLTRQEILAERKKS
jgi:hypothetical protein